MYIILWVDYLFIYLLVLKSWVLILPLQPKVKKNKQTKTSKKTRAHYREREVAGKKVANISRAKGFSLCPWPLQVVTGQSQLAGRHWETLSTNITLSLAVVVFLAKSDSKPTLSRFTLAAPASTHNQHTLFLLIIPLHHYINFVCLIVRILQYDSVKMACL